MQLIFQLQYPFFALCFYCYHENSNVSEVIGKFSYMSDNDGFYEFFAKCHQWVYRKCVKSDTNAAMNHLVSQELISQWTLW